MQDILIVYDSKTGNTEKVAKALAEAAGERCVLAQVDAAPAADDFAVPNLGCRPGERPRCKLPSKCRRINEQGLQGTGYFIYPRCD